MALAFYLPRLQIAQCVKLSTSVHWAGIPGVDGFRAKRDAAAAASARKGPRSSFQREGAPRLLHDGARQEVSPPVLYSYWRSSCSWRVRIALNLKEIPYDIKPISLIKAGGEQHCNEFREINPMEQVPALYIDGHTLVESLNIMHYLEETRPQRPLMPQDVIKRAKVREICEVIASGIQPLQNLIVLIYVGEEKKKEWAQHWINRGFHAVEKLLSTSAGKYCVGDEISIADCCLIPQVFNARRFHVDLRPFPTILRIDRELENHPAFRAAHPSNQPDCPPEATK